MILQFDKDIVVFLSYVKLGEDQQSSQFVDEVGDEGKGIGVLDGMAIKILVVLAGA